MEKNRFLKILCYGTYVVGFQTMVIMDVWGMVWPFMPWWSLPRFLQSYSYGLQRTVKWGLQKRFCPIYAVELDYLETS